MPNNRESRKIEQYVMAYRVSHDCLRALLPAGFSSLRPVLRINAEVRNDTTGYLEFNTPAERDGVRGWLNIASWDNVPFRRDGDTIYFETAFLSISFTKTAFSGGCPAEKDNGGCFFLSGTPILRAPEQITAGKTFCDCRFAWHFSAGDAHGESIGKTLPAPSEPVLQVYPQTAFTPEEAAKLKCVQVLGCYMVLFLRETQSAD